MTFTGLRQSADAVEVDLATSHGTETVSAKWVVGADGMHSAVRTSVGISFDGGSYEGSFVLADVTLDGAGDNDEVSLFFSPDGLVVVAPCRVGATGSWRRARMRRRRRMRRWCRRCSTAGARRPIPRAGRRRVLELALPAAPPFGASIPGGTCLPRGDAAHTHSPAGGQGMNTGLVDAYTLGRLLADVAQGYEGPAILDRYEAMRRPAAKEVLALAGRLTTAATIRSPIARAVRNAVLKVASRLPGIPASGEIRPIRAVPLCGNPACLIGTLIPPE